MLNVLIYVVSKSNFEIKKVIRATFAGANRVLRSEINSTIFENMLQKLLMQKTDGRNIQN